MKGTFFSVEVLNKLATENCDKMFLRYIIRKEKAQKLDGISKFPKHHYQVPLKKIRTYTPSNTNKNNGC